MRYKRCLLNVVKSTSALSVVCLRHWLVAQAVVVVVEKWVDDVFMRVSGWCLVVF